MSTDWPVFLQSEQHTRLRDAIRGALGGWRRFLVAIDGVDAAGKSNLGRYLGWQLGMPVIETDLYFNTEQGGLSYHFDALRLNLDARLSRDRPVIVEGVRVLAIVQELSLVPDFLIWVEQEGHTGSHLLTEQLSTYQTEFAARSRADWIFTWQPDDLTPA